mmetsp:Transcript_4425/g.5819  ORF Transcript_4425/g.5819 Transcript_4425/m.5819 type:complete len:155 (+) Transcript_4425:155-619(+)|eukprot:CAMPEP_0195249832 /NCGR_PEP_ID=MMETSP0706-20130129/2349_1 /TAXON_ID=33640 /ORGANISM="Asterionellopsis glacialis, Strain CCMP134" /LENGTH=154 /DNA_ID=CAMNT_0040301707 /DNA_START=120 /DNA_END=584 /DNA_ORIENTATION=-
MKIPFLLFLSSTAHAFVVSPPSTLSPHHVSTSPTNLHMYESVEAAIEEAQRICAMDPTSPDCRVAWDIVEELEAADSHKVKVPQGPGDNIEYTALMSSFDILVQKIDGKMDQLKATTVKLDELGAGDPAIADLYHRADEMKQALANVRAGLNNY